MTVLRERLTRLTEARTDSLATRPLLTEFFPAAIGMTERLSEGGPDAKQIPRKKTMNFEPCDIVFTNSLPVLGKILHFFGEPWGHVSLATGNGDEVIGAEAEGITRRHLHEWEVKDHVVLRYHQFDLGYPERTAILRWAESQVGNKVYDFLQLIGFAWNLDLHKEGWWVCSSFVYEAYNQAGIELVKRTKPWEVRPQHLYRTSSLETVDL